MHADERLRRQRLAAQLAEREHSARRALAGLTGAKPRNRHGQATPLDDIGDPEQRLTVLRARVERMEALLAQLNRKRETRAKIVMGGALMAEARDLGDAELLARVRDILDRRVERPLDRLAILEGFGIDLDPVRPEDAASPALPDFEALIPEAAKSASLRGGAVHPDYKGITVRRTARADRPHPPPARRAEE